MQILTTNLHTQHILFTFQLSNIYHKQCIYIFIILNIVFHAHTLSLIIIHLKLHTYKPCIIYICIAFRIMSNSQYCFIYKKNFKFLSFKVIKRVQFFLLKMVFYQYLMITQFTIWKKLYFQACHFRSCSHNLYLQCVHFILYLYIVKRMTYKKGEDKVD